MLVIALRVAAAFSPPKRGDLTTEDTEITEISENTETADMAAVVRRHIPRATTAACSAFSALYLRSPLSLW